MLCPSGIRALSFLALSCPSFSVREVRGPVGVLPEHLAPDFLVVVHNLAFFKGIDRELFSRALTGSLCAHVGSLIVGGDRVYGLCLFLALL